MPFGEPLRRLASVDSTNSEAMRWARDDPPAPEGAVVWADDQTAGRGRWGRAWVSVPGGSLTFSLVLRPTWGADRLGLLTLAAGVACADAIRDETGLATSLKWPNDVLVGGLKLAGILSESLVSASGVEAAVVGVGINLHPLPAGVPEEVAARATSIAAGGALGTPPEGLLLAVVKRLEALYRGLGEDEGTVAARAAARCETLGRRVSIRWPDGRTERGVARSIAPDGRLEVESEGRVIGVDVAEVETLRDG
jgi:BirA family biotin operon repressor/biotin-[acetyl-CoA-carboxylase] ligase